MNRSTHTFGGTFEAWSELDPNTSFPLSRVDVIELDGVSFSLHKEAAEVAATSDLVDTGMVVVSSAAAEAFPSKRLPGPVNGLNLATFLAGSSSSRETGF